MLHAVGRTTEVIHRLWRAEMAAKGLALLLCYADLPMQQQGRSSSRRCVDPHCRQSPLLVQHASRPWGLHWGPAHHGRLSSGSIYAL